MEICLYSPLPIESYFIPALPTDAMRTVQKMEKGDAIWNLMWLSYPPLDKLPNSGANWHLGYIAKPSLFSACVGDVNLYETLEEMLHAHPAKFAAWFAKEDHKAWECYEHGGQEWVTTVLARADEAAVRLGSNFKVEGNVISVRFGNR